MLNNMSKVSILCGLAETLRNNDMRLTNAFFGDRFSRDRRYRIFALCGACGWSAHGYGIVGGHEFYYQVLNRDDNYKPTSVYLAMCNGHLREDKHISMIVTNYATQ